jgi:hypothetical protein
MAAVCRYKCQPLANKAFTVLVRHYTQHKSFFDVVSNVRLLADAQEVQQFDQVQ